MPNGNQSYSQLVSGTDQFAHFKQDAGFRGTPSSHRMTGFQKETAQSGSFVFRTEDLSPGKVQSYSRYTRGSVYGAGDSGPTPINPAGS